MCGDTRTRKKKKKEYVNSLFFFLFVCCQCTLVFFNLSPQLVKKDVLLPVKGTAIILSPLFDSEVI